MIAGRPTTITSSVWLAGNTATQSDVWTAIGGPAAGAAIALLAGLIGILIKDRLDVGQWRRDRQLEACVDFIYRANECLSNVVRYGLARSADDEAGKSAARTTFNTAMLDLQRSTAALHLVVAKGTSETAEELSRYVLSDIYPLLQPGPGELKWGELEEVGRIENMLDAFITQARGLLGTK